MLFLSLLFGLGVAAGALTTVAGMGGGLLLLLSMGVASDVLTALAASSPALLIGNLHRSFLYRNSVDWGIVRAFVLGAVPGALLGALVAVAVPGWAVNLLLLGMTLFTLARARGLARVAPPRGAMLPAGFVIGGLTGSAGGAAVLTAPLFLSSGLVGDAYVGTLSVSAVGMHAGRIGGYLLGGLFESTRARLRSAVYGRRARRKLRRSPPEDLGAPIAGGFARARHSRAVCRARIHRRGPALRERARNQSSMRRLAFAAVFLCACSDPAPPNDVPDKPSCDATLPAPSTPTALQVLEEAKDGSYVPLNANDALIRHSGPQGGQHFYVGVQVFSPDERIWTFHASLVDGSGASLAAGSRGVTSCENQWTKPREVTVFLDQLFVALSGTVKVDATSDPDTLSFEAPVTVP